MGRSMEVGGGGGGGGVSHETPFWKSLHLQFKINHPFSYLEQM